VPARVEDTPGCNAAEYDGLDVAGAVVLVDRGVPVRPPAAERGAVVLIVSNNLDEDRMGGTLGRTNRCQDPGH
jgi:hypothetical protein